MATLIFLTFVLSPLTSHPYKAANWLNPQELSLNKGTTVLIDIYNIYQSQMSENRIFRATCFFYNDRKRQVYNGKQHFYLNFFKTKEQTNLESHCYTI